MRHTMIGIVTVLFLSACGPNYGNSDEWDEWGPGLRLSIDAYAAERPPNCAGLQATFDTVDKAPGSDPDILGYIDAKMSDAGCYG